jgi:surface antigen
MNKLALLGSIISLVMLTACNPTKKDIGSLIGAGTGAYVGSQIGDGTGQLAAVAIGALLGGYLGGSVGDNMDELDRRRANSTLEKTPTGRTVAWNNPDTGIDYKVTPTKTYYEDASGPCRNYTTEAVIDGRAEMVHGTACRQSDGSWYATN